MSRWWCTELAVRWCWTNLTYIVTYCGSRMTIGSGWGSFSMKLFYTTWSSIIGYSASSCLASSVMHRLLWCGHFTCMVLTCIFYAVSERAWCDCTGEIHYAKNKESWKCTEQAHVFQVSLLQVICLLCMAILIPYCITYFQFRVQKQRQPMTSRQQCECALCCCCSYSSMAECEPSSSSVEENHEGTSSSSQLDSSIDSLHSSSPSHVTHADTEVDQHLRLCA